MLSILRHSDADTRSDAAPFVDNFAIENEEVFAPLEEIANAIVAQVGAAGALIAWHGAIGGDPAIVFASGTCARSEDSALALQAARGALSQPDRDNPVHARIEIGSSDAIDALTVCTNVQESAATLTVLHACPGPADLVRSRKVLATIGQVIESFFRLWHLRNADLEHLRELALALDCSDVATLLVDRRCRIRFANSVGRELLRRRDGVCARGPVLAAANLSDTMRLQAAISHVCVRREHAQAASPAPVLALNRTQGRPLLVAVMANDANPGIDGGHSAIVCLFDPERDLAPLVEPACNLYRLSPVEARLACLIANGRSLAEAATTLRIREQTARSYLKQIFLKTDTKRQAELVWLLLKSSVSTSPGRRTSFL